MIDHYPDLVRAYLRDGDESHLAQIGALRSAFVAYTIPIEELVGLHERALLLLKDEVTADTYADVVARTSTCLTELMVAYSLADQRRKGLLEREQQLERERHRLEALGQMAGGVAHEFNNLLQPIVGMAEMALEDASAGGELAEQLGIILTCARHATTITRGITTVARKQGPPARALVLAPLLRKTVQVLAAIIPNGVTIDLAIGSEDDRVLCEEAELAQVLLNLVRNASDAMNEQGTVRIAIDRRDRDPAISGSAAGMAQSHLILSVGDNGIGMSSEVAARAFHPFFTTKSPERGTGLGLSIIMAIVDGWTGTVDIETAPGQGTTVKIVLPRLS